MDKCVLIVDDNDFNRELVKDILEDEDITVYEAEDGSSAIELLESEQSISGKAHFLVRKLKSTGWILIETENDFRAIFTSFLKLQNYVFSSKVSLCKIL